ncbi:MAG: kynureninase [Thermoanaerobaculales bacterium]
MAPAATREQAEALDREDPLAAIRDDFILPEGVIYLDGNSLGALPRATPSRLAEVAVQEWGGVLVRGWTEHGWIDLPLRVGNAIAGILGALPGEVAVTDSTSVNLFKLMAAALRMRPGRMVILTERENFPTDLYVAAGLADLLGGRVEVRVVERSDLVGALDARVAVLALTHVDFRTGEMHDMAALTALAHRAGALALWDLSHSAGAVPLALDACEVDLAVGCGYKYLNGGPGAPAYVFVAHRLHEEFRQPLSGWTGHAAPFEFGPEYRPAAGIARALVGTPPILSMTALACGVETIVRAGVERLRGKSLALSELFIERMAERCAPHGFELASPRDLARRGSHVSYRHPQGYAIKQALIHSGVIGDFRAPDMVRFGFAPAYLRFVDAWDAVERLAQVMERRAWDRPDFRSPAKVT